MRKAHGRVQTDLKPALDSEGYMFETETTAMLALRAKSASGIVYRTTDGKWSWALEGSWIGLACEYLWNRKSTTVDVTDLQGKVLFVIERARRVRPWDATCQSSNA